ncbi:MAG TPA: tetratricopeptide repeat protein [Pedobacter sp.]|uniref:tetratricopeptide repeat protein n=1 Tax=Pedobacter sp. TaxID=1411316 RepID=UPI002B51B140|nr:tetratricopeptide repeat protein [Pedobacter sp.]HMI05408.1 tetratricopeptide repeat protein [Pedobacter sp.]
MYLYNRLFVIGVSIACCFNCIFLGVSCCFSANKDGPKEPLSYTERLVLTNPDSAFLLVQKLRKEYAGRGDVHALAICNQQLGKIFHYQGAYAQALTFYLKADKVFRREHDRLLIAQNLNNIAQTYSSAHLKQKSLPMFKEALKIFQELRNDKGIAKTYSLLGKFFEKKGTYGISFDYQQLALRHYKKISDSLGLAKVYNDIGSILERKRQYNDALKYFTLALSINRSLDNRLGQIGNINNIGDFYRKTGDYINALSATMQAKALAIELKSKRELISACDNLAQTYKLIGNTDSAYYYSETASKNYHQTFKEESSKQINLLQTFFEVEKKDSEIQQLKVDKKITLISTGAVVAICLLLTLLGFTILSKQRMKSRDDKIIFDAQQSFMKVQLKNKMLEQNLLSEELELKSKELTSHTLHIIQKNQLLEELKGKLNTIVKSDKRDQRKEVKQLIDLISTNSDQDKNWNDFRVVFEKVHVNFFAELKKYCEGLTSADLRLLALLKMNLDSSDIATMIGISQDSLRTSKYRLRQKLQIPEGENLLGFVQQF